MKFKNMKIGTRLALAFTTVVLITLTISALSNIRMGLMNQNTDKIVVDLYPKTELAHGIINNVNHVSLAIRNTLLFVDAGMTEAEIGYIRNTQRKTNELIEKLEAETEPGKGRNLIGAIKDRRQRFDASLDRLIELGKSDGIAATNYLIDEFRPVNAAYLGSIEDLIRYQGELMRQGGNASMESYASSHNFLIAMAVLSALLSASLGFWITRSLLKQLGGEPNYAAEIAVRIAAGDRTVTVETHAGDQSSLLFAMKHMNESLNAGRTETERMVKEVATIVDGAAMGDFSVRMDMTGKSGLFQQVGEGINKLMQTCETGLGEVARVFGAMSRGDLTEKITDDYSGTFGQLKADSNNTMAQMNRTMYQIKESTNSITTAAQQISDGNSDLSKRTEEQASSLEETASSMEELTSTVKQNADNARQANQMAESASDIAVKGGQVVGEVVQTMASISASAKRIVDIISVIEGIAFQTNILALNAAVEAARAGEQGRGFAVVASEVRSLAQRSAAAAKEIKILIGDSVEKVDVGSKQVDHAGATMNEIVIAVKRVTDIMSEIAAASAEQSAGIEQVNQAITQMDKVTQQNAALVEHAATAALSLRQLANTLYVTVNEFKLDRRRSAEARPAIAAQVSAAAAMLRNEKLLSGQPREHRLVKAAESKDGDWKEF